jgi:hypothetical protein
MTRSLGLLLLCVTTWLAGCSSVPIPPTYTIEELAARCSRDGGVWRSFVGDGYCEHQSPGFL